MPRARRRGYHPWGPCGVWRRCWSWSSPFAKPAGGPAYDRNQGPPGRGSVVKCRGRLSRPIVWKGIANWRTVVTIEAGGFKRGLGGGRERPAGDSTGDTMADLNTHYMGISLSSPLIVAASTISRYIRRVKMAEQ